MCVEIVKVNLFIEFGKYFTIHNRTDINNKSQIILKEKYI